MPVPHYYSVRHEELLTLWLNDNGNMPHGWHTIGIECKGVLSIGIYGLLVGNKVGVGLTWSSIRPLLPSLFPVKEAIKQRPHVSEPPVARTGQNPLRPPGWETLLATA